MADFQYAIINGNLTVSGGKVTTDSNIIMYKQEIIDIAIAMGMEVEEGGADEEV